MICDLEDEQSGPIDFAEFFQLITSRVSDKDTKASIHKLFNLFDEDKVGKISIENLKKIVRDLGENIPSDHLEQMIKVADLDHDGFVSENEFYCGGGMCQLRYA